jgi:hypothetical protein
MILNTTATIRSAMPNRESDGQLLAMWRSHYSLSYSALALFRIGMSGSASFQRVRKAS